MNGKALAPDGEQLSSQPLYHGTNAALKPGDFIKPGKNSNCGKRKKAAYVYLTATLGAATWGARAGPRRRTRPNLRDGTDRPDCR